MIDLRKTDIDRFKREALQKPLSPATVNRCLSVIRRALQLGADHDPPLVTRAIPRWFGKLPEDNVRTGVVSIETYRAVNATHARMSGRHFASAITWGCVSARFCRSDGNRSLESWRDSPAPEADESEKAQDRSNLWRHAICARDGARDMSVGLPVRGAGRRSPRIQYQDRIRGRVRIRANLLVEHRAAPEETGSRYSKAPVLFHDLRRTAATNMDEAGITRERIKDCVGWETDAMFARYRIGSTKGWGRLGSRWSVGWSATPTRIRSMRSNKV